MAILDWFKRSAAAAASTTDWDEYPVHLMDRQKMNYKVLGWAMRFNDVLDADQLHCALTQLLELGDWRKLGGRLREDNNGHLKILVPKRFTPSYPAVEYKHFAFAQSIAAHPVGARFISQAAKPSIQPLNKDLRRLMAPEDYPDTVDGLLQTDKSQLSLAISSFDDATIVSLAFPHTLLDAVSYIQLVRNWSLVLAGRETEVAPLLDAYNDALEDVTKQSINIAPEECRMEKVRLKGIGYWKLVARNMAEAVWRQRSLQALYIPKEIYERLLVTLREGAETEELTGRKQINEVDLLTSWLIRTIATQEGSPRPITLLTLYNLRYYVQKLKEARHEGSFAQNMVSFTYTTFPSDSSQKSVGEIAKSYKEQAHTLTTEDEAVALLKHIRGELQEEKSQLPLYGTSDSLVVFCNPLARLDLIKMADFAPAIKSTSRDVDGSDKHTPPGRMVGNVFNPLNWTDVGTDLLFPLGTDYDGGCWIMAKLTPGSWKSVADDLRKLS
ncbi:hypothetical protein QQS21_010007 [Conoideocrella luteorostrata]|uniref:Uncharacterized protein n=1 Tax=Conoideocrella luteorostrata TaxID=1105319 RepID=A0AAJ0FPU1_9HYPO|nr:hypothetical protein QQS21_010007 [Conoideocrella luteorostrata]